MSINTRIKYLRKEKIIISGSDIIKCKNINCNINLHNKT